MLSNDKEFNSLMSSQNAPDYGYKYPTPTSLKPGSETSKRLLSFLLGKLDIAYSHVQGQHGRWSEMDSLLRMYVPLKDEEKRAKAKNPLEPVSIVVPVTYATEQTFLTYLSATFFHDPMFRYKHQGGEDKMGTILLQKIIQQQLTRPGFSAYPQLLAAYKSIFRYGRGAVNTRWIIEKGKKVRQKKTTKMQDAFNALGELIGVKKKTVWEKGKVLEDATLWEGNQIDAINMYGFMPDPNAPATRIHQGEVHGWVNPNQNMYTLLQREASDPSTYFNAKYLFHAKNDTRFAIPVDKKEVSKVDDWSSAITSIYMGSDVSGDMMNAKSIVYVYAKIIPKDWGLSPYDKPQPWYFEIAADSVFLAAVNLDFAHGRAPISQGATEYGATDAYPMGKLEVSKGLQNTINWVFNTRYRNARMTINSGWLADPTLINIPDLMNPEAGMIVRATQQAWGRTGVLKDALVPLPAQDVTSGFMNDVFSLREITSDVTGAQDVVRGLRRSGGERVTATEAENDKTAALSRMAMDAFSISQTLHSDVAYQLAYNTQQFMTMDTYVDTMGPTEAALREEFGINGDRRRVTPWDLLIDWDVNCGDSLSFGTPNPDVMAQIFQVLVANPAIGRDYDLPRMMRALARASGFEDINDFRLKQQPQGVDTTVMEDDAVQEQVRQGNMIPAEQSGVEGIQEIAL